MNMASMKNLSFGKLMALFGAGLIAVMLIAVIIIKLASAPKPTGAVVTQRHQTQFQPQQPDILAEQLRREQESAAAAKAAAAQQTQAMQQALQQHSQVLTQRLESISNNMSMLEQRIAAVENIRRPTSVQIVKPERNRSEKKQLYGDGKTFPLPANLGYRVQATVGNRAWISAGDHEVNLTVGEALPPAPPLVVQTIDPESGVVITSSAPR